MVLSILITHYNRSQALRECIDSFRSLNLGLSLEFVVCDDCSKADHLNEVKKISGIQLIGSESNSGLGANINKGIRHCSGEFILYCQEDFLITSSFTNVIDEVIGLLRQDKADMVRLTANYKFPKLIPVSKNVSRIPKLSTRNFLYNAFQYSDNPFVIKNDFFEKNGAYLENVKGNYCELEYAIRIMRSKVKVAILNHYIFNAGSHESVLNYTPKAKKKRRKNWHKFLRAARLHLEWLFYNPKKRELLTFKKSPHHLTKKEV
jgi:glycosyltransferase involved in cell wall biosynthesis